MPKDSPIKTIPYEIISFIVELVALDLTNLPNLARVNKFFSQILANKFLQKNFLIAQICKTLKHFTNIDITQIEGYLLKHINTDEDKIILKKFLILIIVSLNSTKFANISNLIKELHDNQLIKGHEQLDFLIQLSIARLYIDPNFSYRLDEGNFDVGFNIAQACFKKYRNQTKDTANPTSSFILGAYWRNLHNKFSEQGLANDAVKALDLARDYTTIAIRSINEKLLHGLPASHSDMVLAFAHPHADLFFRQLISLSDKNDAISILNLAPVSTDRLYQLCFRNYHWLLQQGINILSIVNGIDNEKFHLLGQPDVQYLIKKGELTIEEFREKPVNDFLKHKKKKRKENDSEDDFQAPSSIKIYKLYNR